VVRWIAPLALFALFAVPEASAQFTTFVAHPPRAADSTRAPMVALSDSARRAQADSATRAELTNMKTWVDSAAIAAGTRVPIPVDSTPAVTPGAVGSADGLRAPDTATPLPTLLLGGFGAMAAGFALLRRRR